MNPFFPVLFIVSSAISRVGAQSLSSPSDGSSTNFEPSLAIMVGILGIMFCLTFIFLIYAKWSQSGLRSFSFIHGDNNPAGLNNSRSRFSGIDRTVIESLPFFRFSSLKGSKQGLECSVCLSKFEDVEILRLLPKCKHAFHVNCIDRWLETHSSCPLCRHRISADDPTIFAYSNSRRFLWSQSHRREDSNIELFVQREEDRPGSTRFNCPEQDNQKSLHKFNHRIIVSDFVFKNRWSNLSSSDMMHLNSEMLNEISSNRFSSSLEVTGQFPVPVIENEQSVKVKEEIEMKRSFQTNANLINETRPILPSTSNSTASSSKNQTSRIIMNQNEKRSMSEITGFSRFRGLGVMNRTGDSASALSATDIKEDRIRQLWLQIAQRTVQWFANGKRLSLKSQDTIQHLDV
ncbi:hypothetical protein SLEP1_g22933 [Rubroshorea leprosula]|uniref:RING-type E3 ubiquitin transferase n=1 Tax=Rubroshorea leprosula TaxID=152421 RepID=A0AAV5JI23_9ROSI|nr:hypothetical protein SLEP1_g22933 [Rubroshorea leprosula]